MVVPLAAEPANRLRLPELVLMLPTDSPPPVALRVNEPPAVPTTVPVIKDCVTLTEPLVLLKFIPPLADRLPVAPLIVKSLLFEPTIALVVLKVPRLVTCGDARVSKPVLLTVLLNAT